MSFFWSRLLYGLMLGAYAVSIALFFVDFLRDSRAANRVGLVVLGVVWLLVTGFMGVRFVAEHRLPIFTSSQATVFYAWLLITVSIVVGYLYRIDFFVFFVNLLGFLLLAFDALVHHGGPAAPVRTSDLLVVHIGVAFLSYLAFAVSLTWSVLYLLEDSALREKRFTSGSFRRLPALERLDAYAYKSALIGIPLLLLAVVLGSIWYLRLTGRYPLTDPKAVASTLLLFVYGLYAWLRGTGRLGGKRAAWWNVASFSCVIINFFVVGAFLSKFHRW